MIDYGKNKLTIGDEPAVSVITEGAYLGSPCIRIPMGVNKEYTNRLLADKLDRMFPLTPRVLFTYEDPTVFSEELFSFIKYHKKTSEKPMQWFINTTGLKFIPKFLYELDNILIDVRCPSSGLTTPPEFISWCVEDPFLKDKIEFRFCPTPNTSDINYTASEIMKLSTFKRPITVQPNKGWESYVRFVAMFCNTIRSPYVRILPDLHIEYKFSDANL